jgi:hypothetical protein
MSHGSERRRSALVAAAVLLASAVGIALFWHSLTKPVSPTVLEASRRKLDAELAAPDVVAPRPRSQRRPQPSASPSDNSGLRAWGEQRPPEG